MEDYYTETPIPRYVRINPRRKKDTDAIVAAMEDQTGYKLAEVPWLPGFYSLPVEARIIACDSYRSGDVYGMDVASGMAVAALSVSPSDHVLDLCSAPGAKMCMIHDLLGSLEGATGTVTGVDISRHRLSTCRSLLRKYKLTRARLFLADGTTFNVLAPSRVGRWTREAKSRDVVQQPAAEPALSVPINFELGDDFEDELADIDGIFEVKAVESDSVGKQGEGFVKPFHATRLLREDTQLNSASLLYDKVLVDAECTHDGSISHLLKCDRVGWDKFESYFFDPVKMNALERLQRGLLMNGFRLLRPGGVLVYSTCSFSKRQNEDVVTWLLDSEPRAVVVPVVGAEALPTAPELPDCDARLVGNVLRFTPSSSRTSGLFIARIEKQPNL
ncbi:hypothetical protein HK101_004034 [Irineochytrium annulatum]|nr:hypothetical protein HK101_004034 [Irineochytrium annulatum]